MFSRPEEIVEYFKAKLDAEAAGLGIKFVGGYDEKLIPRYPAVVVSAGNVEKSLHATHTFNVTLRAFLWIYHGDMTKTHRQRSLEDLQFATGVVQSIEADLTLNKNVIMGWIEAETPGLIQPKTDKGSVVIGTRLNWQGLSQIHY